MALLDYKLVRFSHDKRHVTATLRVYRGAVTTEDERNINGEMVPVTRYRRIATVAERTFEYDVPQEMSKEDFIRKARAYFNNKLLTFTQKNGHTIITEQQDTTDLEPVDNETGNL
jgi:hypothetical protein